MNEFIIIKGARTHNLKNFDLKIPRNKLVVITGLSGSGKTSLAFDTLYAEGQRRYVESLSAYARQFLKLMQKPDFDFIDGLSPAISIEQKQVSHNPRSTVGTITEINDYLRLLFSRIGVPYCPKHNISLESQTVSQIVDTILFKYNNFKVMILAPLVLNRKGEYLDLFKNLLAQGFVRVRINEQIYDLDSIPTLQKNTRHTIELVIDRLKIDEHSKQRLSESIELALDKGNSKVLAINMDTNEEANFSEKFSCPKCSYSISDIDHRLFSFNSPVGKCNKCDGLGYIEYFDPDLVVRNPDLSILDGAIPGWDKRNSSAYAQMQNLSKFVKFDLNVSFKELHIDFQKVILYGIKDSSGFYFEGIINILERRLRETDSFIIRDSLLKLKNKIICPECNGSRLNQYAMNVRINNLSFPQISNLTLHKAKGFFSNLKLNGSKQEISDRILKEIISRLNFLINVGLDYLTLSRNADTLSGGESQRIRLASQIGSGLTGVMYVLDEPSIGLHQKDNDRLLNTLKNLRDLGNTVIVVEHDEDAIKSADYIIDMGQGAGEHGGNVIFAGTSEEILHCNKSLTGKYLSGKRKIQIPKHRVLIKDNKFLSLYGAYANNLKNVDLKIPVGLITCITGVSGSGKSTLINDTLAQVVLKELNLTTSNNDLKYKKIEGLEYLDKIININQLPIGRTPRSNPATYTGLFTPIRELYSQMRVSKERGYSSSRFSFNLKGGRCEACQGDGIIKVDMHFLADIFVRCEVCNGTRYNRETLDVKYKGKNISQVLDMTVQDAMDFFDAIPVVNKKLQTLMDVGLGYIRLGQSATTLSGGEAQRVKLSLELSKKDTGKTLYILDEPTTGLHFEDISLLIKVLQRLQKKGNTIIIIEHNLDVIKISDYIIDLGPDGGDNGGRIIAIGTPEEVSKNKKSYTGQYLLKILKQ